ncbi:hypothetical protein AB0B28_06870 [Glycomyces sp. NPDC046736]|uniref:hypothetical protein n=1 Tax=Glycomyces sp. NPDC046736 TaxID=3155615 RepID=UPI0033CE10AD
MKVYTAIVGPRDGEWFPVEVPAVPGVFTQARDFAEAEEMAREAVALMLDVPASEIAIRVEWGEPFFRKMSKRIRDERRPDSGESESG